MDHKSAPCDLREWLIVNNGVEKLESYIPYKNLYTTEINQKKYFIKRLSNKNNEYKIIKCLQKLSLPTVQSVITLLSSNVDIEYLFTKYKSKKKSYYMISEKIEGVPLVECMMDFSREDFENVLQVIFFTLDTAWRNVGFVHNDLHLNNIMIQKLDQPKLLKRDCKGCGVDMFHFDNEIIAVNYLPILIDFELSILNHKKGKTIFHDIWRLLGSLSLYMKKEKGELVLDYIEHFIERNDFQERKEEFANQWFRIPPRLELR
jgi:thiamine kinase-like enzyme